MQLNNKEIALYAYGKGVMLWELADAIGIADASLSRKLRKPLPPETTQLYKLKIYEIARNKEGK